MLQQQHKIKNITYSPAPAFNLDEEYAVQHFTSSLIKENLIQSAHDISEGGLFICLMEKSFNRQLGFELFSDKNIRKDAFFFGESQGRIVISCTAAQEEDIRRKAAATGIPVWHAGIVTNDEVRIDGHNWGKVSDWKKLYDEALDNLLND